MSAIQEWTAPEPLYRLSELAAQTGRSVDFWEGEIAAGRLECIQQAPGCVRLVSASAYDAWFLAGLQAPQQAEEQAEAAVAAAMPAREWVDFEA
jgi:hypothetical protein